MSTHVGWALFWGTSAVMSVVFRTWFFLPVEVGFCAYHAHEAWAARASKETGSEPTP